MAYAAGGDAELAVAAELAGFHRSGHRRSEPPRKSFRKARPASTKGPEAPVIDTAPLADALFWCPTAYRLVAGDGETLPAAEPPPPGPALVDVVPESPAMADLAPWNAILSAMRQTAVAWSEGQAPDVPAMLRQVERGRLLDRLPRRRRRRWGTAIQIIFDRSERLVPFYEDQERVAGHLSRLFPTHALERATMEDGSDEPVLTDRDGRPAWCRLPSPGTLVIVLGIWGAWLRLVTG